MKLRGQKHQQPRQINTQSFLETKSLHTLQQTSRLAALNYGRKLQFPEPTRAFNYQDNSLQNESVRAKRLERSLLKQRQLEVKRERNVILKEYLKNDQTKILKDLNFEDEFQLFNKIKSKAERAKNENAAIVLQKIYRMFKVRKQFRILRDKRVKAAIKLQRCWRRIRVELEMKKMIYLTYNNGAKRIQKYLRSFLVYKRVRVVKERIRKRFMETYFKQKRIELYVDSQIKISYFVRKFLVIFPHHKEELRKQQMEDDFKRYMQQKLEEEQSTKLSEQFTQELPKSRYKKHCCMNISQSQKNLSMNMSKKSNLSLLTVNRSKINQEKSFLTSTNNKNTTRPRNLLQNQSFDFRQNDKSQFSQPEVDENNQNPFEILDDFNMSINPKAVHNNLVQKFRQLKIDQPFQYHRSRSSLGTKLQNNNQNFEQKTAQNQNQQYFSFQQQIQENINPTQHSIQSNNSQSRLSQRRQELKQKKRIKPMDMIQLDDMLSNMNQHHLFTTNTMLVRVLDATQDEKDDYQEYLDRCKQSKSREINFVDFLLKVRESKGELAKVRRSHIDYLSHQIHKHPKPSHVQQSQRNSSKYNQQDYSEKTSDTQQINMIAKKSYNSLQQQY
eukprot:403344337